MPDAAAPGSALAARCTACGTVFRIVPDQLRVSGGWVRCGRCAQVFNASENLIDLDSGVPRRLDPGHAGYAQPPAAATPPAPAPAPPMPQPASLANQPAQPWATAATTPADPVADAAVADRASAGSLGMAGGRAQDKTQDRAQPTPSFLRQAERAARWRQPRVRAALAAGCGLAALLLAGQALHAARDTVAAQVPALRPLLAQGCAWLGCTLQAPRRDRKSVV